MLFVAYAHLDLDRRKSAGARGDGVTANHADGGRAAISVEVTAVRLQRVAVERQRAQIVDKGECVERRVRWTHSGPAIGSDPRPVLEIHLDRVVAFRHDVPLALHESERGELIGVEPTRRLVGAAEWSEPGFRFRVKHHHLRAADVDGAVDPHRAAPTGAHHRDLDLVGQALADFEWERSKFLCTDEAGTEEQQWEERWTAHREWRMRSAEIAVCQRFWQCGDQRRSHQCQALAPAEAAAELARHSSGAVRPHECVERVAETDCRRVHILLSRGGFLAFRDEPSNPCSHIACHFPGFAVRPPTDQQFLADIAENARGVQHTVKRLHAQGVLVRVFLS